MGDDGARGPAMRVIGAHASAMLAFRETVGRQLPSTTSVQTSNLAPGRALVYAPCMHRLVLCLGLWSAALSAAEVYRWVDPDGNTQYSDQPRPDA